MNPKSDCIYHLPIDLEQQTDVRLYPNQSVNGKFSEKNPQKKIKNLKNLSNNINDKNTAKVNIILMEHLFF